MHCYAIICMRKGMIPNRGPEPVCLHATQGEFMSHLHSYKVLVFFWTHKEKQLATIHATWQGTPSTSSVTHTSCILRCQQVLLLLLSVASSHHVHSLLYRVYSWLDICTQATVYAQMARYKSFSLMYWRRSYSHAWMLCMHTTISSFQGKKQYYTEVCA